MATKIIHQYTAANTIDSAADFLLIDPASSGVYKSINRSVLLGISGSPLGTSDTQNVAAKTLDNTNVITIKDGSFTLQKTGSLTKQAVFDLGSITGGNTRTVSLPDANTALPIASQILTFAGPTAARTYTFPDAATTIAGIATAQTLTNKTITDSTNVLGGVTMTLGSDAAGDTYYRTGSVLTRLPIGTAGQVLTVNGGATAPAWGTSGSQVSLLKANSGTSTNASTTNVDTFALSGLTAKDTLLIYYDLASTTQDTNGLVLASTTDSKVLVELCAGASIVAGNVSFGEARIRQAQTASTSYNAQALDVNGANLAAGGATSTGSARLRQTTSNTAWTGSWTIALQHAGVVSGGTFAWSWSVYKLAGQ